LNKLVAGEREPLAGLMRARRAVEPFPAQIVLSFDVEEHHRIEAAAGLTLGPRLQELYSQRVGPTTQELLARLAEQEARATFFIVGTIAQQDPALVRAIHDAGHEVASHGWDHQRIHNLTPAAFREDVRRSKGTLEQIIGAAVVGYRAPTFSVMRQTAWAIDVLAELGLAYDSSIYPVWHDRYGVPGAPRWPYRVCGRQHTLLEIPPTTLRLCGANVPMAGGGSFRLFPLFLLEAALRQTERTGQPPVAMLYFHPWEFDPGQPRLPLRGLRRFRTYVGMSRSRERLRTLLSRHRFTRAMDVVGRLQPRIETLPQFTLAGRAETAGCRQGRQERLDALRQIDDVDAQRQVLAQLQQSRRVQAVVGPVAFGAARHRGAGDAFLLAHLHDGRVERPAVPLIGAVDEHRHLLGVHLGFHVFALPSREEHIHQGHPQQHAEKAGRDAGHDIGQGQPPAAVADQLERLPLER
jgi:polysaccharide deacetylase family protein (PEP-CTERM system associated)